MKTVSNNSNAPVPRREPVRSANVTSMSRSPTPRRRATLASLGGRAQGLPHHDLQRLQPARPAVGRSARTGARHGQAARVSGAGPGGALAAHPQGRRGRPGDDRTAELFVQRSRGAGLRRGPRRVVRGGGSGPAAGRGRTEPNRRATGRPPCSRRVSTASWCTPRPTTTRICRSCCSAICRSSSSTSPRTCRAPRGSASTTAPPWPSSPNTLWSLATGRSGCSRCDWAGSVRRATASRWSASPDRLQTPHFHVQRERINGVYDAMIDAGLDPASLTVVESYEHQPTSGGVGGRGRPRRQPAHHRVDVHRGRAGALGDGLPAGTGIYVPGQMTVTGFDGVPEALRRGLTTVKQPSLEKGRRAGDLLHSPPRSGSAGDRRARNGADPRPHLGAARPDFRRRAVGRSAATPDGCRPADGYRARVRRPGRTPRTAGRSDPPR